jgi:Mrp family chromosome partitioning ATPase
MAARFGELGSKVVLVDLDLDYPDISRCFGVRGDGLSALIESDTAPGAATTVDTPAFTPTPLPNVVVVGREPGVVDTLPQRADLLDAMEVALEDADVVIFDTGPMLAAHAATVLAQQADAVVLAIPVMNQDRAALLVIARQVAPLKAYLLPVAMPRLERSRRLPVASAPSALADDDDDGLSYPAAS